MKPARALWLLSYLLIPATMAHAAPVTDSKEVNIKADTMSVDIPADSYRAKGNVRMLQDGISLLADSVIYSRLTDDAVAEGDVLVEKEGDTLRGDKLTLNMDTRKGELSNGELFVKKPNFWVRARRMEKTGDDDYRLERGSFTTCDGPNPSWRFEARDLQVTLEEFATARDAVFYVGDIPLLYTPYLIFPVKRERQSGLLIPRFGHSSKKGAYYNQPIYWAIDPSQDVTFNVDLESSRGVGLGVDYRYLRSHGSHGELQAFGIYDTSDSRFRGELNQSHLELLSPQTTLASDIHLIADRDYYRDYGEFSGEYNRQLLVSTASIDHRWERYAAWGEVRYTEDLMADNNDATLQRLPELGFIATGEKLGPLFLSMDSGFINFQRVDGVTGQRLELHPRLSYYAKPAAPLDLSLYAGYRQRFYASDDGTDDGLEQVGQPDAGGSLSLPLERIYGGELRHLLVPALEYDFVQHGPDRDKPFFDWNDRVLGQSMARLSFTNVLTRKFTREGGTPVYRELLYLKLSEGYQFGGERRDLLTLVDEGHKVTDLMLEGRVNPTERLTVGFDGRYNPVDGVLSTGNVGVEYKEGTNLAQLGYRYSRGEVKYLEGRFAFPLGSRLSAKVLERYSFDKGGFLESRYALEYKRQCWSVTVSYSDRAGSSEISHNREVSVNFTLAGVGSLLPVRAF